MKNKITWHSDLVFQKIPGNVYIMVANRRAEVTNIVYDESNIEEFKANGNSVELIIDK